MAENSTVAAPSVVGSNARAMADMVSRDGTRAKPKPPSDFDDEHDFLRHVRETYAKDLEADRINREEMIKDNRFVAGEQWEADVKEARDRKNKPTLTINRLPAYVAQLVGNRRLNDTGIKIIPDMGGTKEVADIREGLIRNIQKNSRAQFAYDKAFEQQVIGGLGNFQIHLDYAHDDVFEQDIRIVSIPNPLSVVWDQNSVDPTGADAEHVFVTDRLPRREFKRRYPNAKSSDFDATDMEVRSMGWDTQESSQVVSFWRVRSRKRTVAMLQDGTVIDVTDAQDPSWWDFVAVAEGGLPMVREVQRKYAELYICSSQDILEGPYELPIDRVPVFKVTGWELFIEGDRIRWGMVRHARDPQKLHNYWRSTIAEKLIGSPKAKWLASSSAVEGREDQWRRSHLDDDPLLVWNAESGSPPIRTPPVDMEQALIAEAGLAAQDIRDVTNIHEAQLGQHSNEVSGRAIMARQRVGEVGTVTYQDNLNAAIEESGKVINQLIPFVYDTARMVKILGEDMMTEKQVRINDAEDPESKDITVGKYSVTVTTGPSYTTRRVEAREEMMAMVNAMPQVMGIAADKIVEAQDWPGAADIARRLRTQLPPGMVSERDMDEEQRTAQQAQAEQQGQQAQVQMEVLRLELAEKAATVQLKEAQVREALARAEEAEARAEQARANAMKMSAAIENERVEAAATAMRADVDAFKAASDVEQKEVDSAIRAAQMLRNTSTSP